MYLVVTNHAVSVVLIRLDQDVQKLIFYVSKTLVEVETHYLTLEKAVLLVIHATQNFASLLLSSYSGRTDRAPLKEP